MLTLVFKNFYQPHRLAVLTHPQEAEPSFVIFRTRPITKQRYIVEEIREQSIVIGLNVQKKRLPLLAAFKLGRPRIRTSPHLNPTEVKGGIDTCLKLAIESAVWCGLPEAKKGNARNLHYDTYSFHVLVYFTFYFLHSLR